MALAGVQRLAAAVFVVGALCTLSPALAQESSKSEESSRETREEIRSIMSDIEKRHPSSVPTVIRPSEVRTVSAAGRVAWKPLLPLGVAVVFAMLAFVVFGIARVSRGTKLLIVVAGLVLVVTTSIFVTPLDPRPVQRDSPDPGERAQTSEAERRMTVCLGQLRSPRECFEEENARERRIEEMAEAIRRSRR